MKKVLTLVSLAFMALSLNAQGVSWYFNNWSRATLDALHEDMVNNNAANWRNYESDATKADEQHYWISRKMAGALVTKAGPDAANDTIKETKGLVFGASNAKKLVITYNHNNREEHGQFLWFNGKNETMTASNIVGGQKLKLAIESHSGSEARGFTITFCGTALTSPTGNFTPVEYTEYELDLPEGTGDLVFKTTNGCHLFYVIVGDGGPQEEPVEETPTVAYLYDGTYNGAKDANKTPCGWLANGGLDNDPIYSVLQSYESTAIDYATCGLTSEELNDSLLKFDVVVVGEAVSSKNALAQGLKEIVNKVPMLNLKSFMYKSGVWSFGAGANPDPKATSIKLLSFEADDPLFEGIEGISEDSLLQMFEVEEGATINGNLMQGYSVDSTSIFANDEVIATAGGVNAIHVHGTKNRYMLIPISSDNMNNLTSDAQMLVYNAVGILAKTKSDVQKAATPVVVQTNENLSTTVTLTCRTAGSSIYYTLDGSAPSTESTLYAEPLTIEKDSTLIRAIAVAHGYNTSDTAQSYIRVFKKLTAPVISVAYEDGYSVITIDTIAGERSNIYYAFTEENTKARTSVYNGPITVKDAGTIYAFADWATAVQSETVSLDFSVTGAPAAKDTVAHFLPSVANWKDSCLIYWADTLVGNWDAAIAAGVAGTKSSAFYHFGTSAKSNLVFDHNETVLDSLGNVIKSLVDPTQDSIVAVNVVDPKVNGKVISTTNPGWEVLSNGQVMTIENAAPEHFIGNGATTRCADAAIDMITGGPVCKGLMDFGGKASGCSYNLRVQTTEKVAAPFFVEVYLGNGSTNNACAIAVQVSTDGETWTTIQDLTLSETQRYWRRSKVQVNEEGQYLVRIAQLGNTSKAQLYDVLVVTTEGVTGIENVNANVNHNDNRIFDMQGRRVNTMVRGQLYIQNGKKVIVK